MKRPYRWLSILLVTLRTWSAEAPSLLELPPCFGHGMVLQQCEVSRQNEQVVLWGWAATHETISIDLPGQPHPIKAVPLRREMTGSRKGLKCWQVRVRDLEAPLRALTSQTLIVRSEKGSSPIRTVVRTNVAVGDVWVVGVEPMIGIHPHRFDTNRLGGSPGLLRVIQVSDLVWTNWAPGEFSGWQTSAWRVVDSQLAASPQLPALAGYLLQSALNSTASVPVGMILVSPSRLGEPLVRNQRLAGFDGWSPSMRRCIAAAAAASKLAEADAEEAMVEFRSRMKQAKRRGEVAADLGIIAPQPVRPLAQASAGPFPFMGYAVAGACW